MVTDGRQRLKEDGRLSGSGSGVWGRNGRATGERETGETTDRIDGTRCQTAGTACEWDLVLEIVSKRDCIVSEAARETAVSGGVRQW